MVVAFLVACGGALVVVLVAAVDHDHRGRTGQDWDLVTAFPHQWTGQPQLPGE